MKIKTLLKLKGIEHNTRIVVGAYTYVHCKTAFITTDQGVVPEVDRRHAKGYGTKLLPL